MLKRRQPDVENRRSEKAERHGDVYVRVPWYALLSRGVRAECFQAGALARWM